MSIIQSLLLGAPGNYNILGIDTSFQTQDNNPLLTQSLRHSSFIGRIAMSCTENRVFQILSLGYFHVLIHELGHATIARLFSNQPLSVTIYQKTCSGSARINKAMFSNWQATMTLAAGPMFGIALEMGKLAICAFFLHSLSTLASAFVAAGSLIWIIGELFYIASSSLSSGLIGGDFNSIAQQGNTHLLAAITAVIVEVVLGFFFILHD